MNANRKGKELEEALFLIESLIIDTNPTLKSADIKILKNKIFIVDEVKHEIDLFVEINLGNGYEAIYIYLSAKIGIIVMLVRMKYLLFLKK